MIYVELWHSHMIVLLILLNYHIELVFDIILRDIRRKLTKIVRLYSLYCIVIINYYFCQLIYVWTVYNLLNLADLSSH